MNAIPARSRSDWERLAAPLRTEGRALINGQLVGARSGHTFEKKSPIDGWVIAHAIEKYADLKTIWTAYNAAGP